MQNKKKFFQGALLTVGLLTFSLSACSPSEQEQEKEALEFLYASMPLPDSVDYPREFWENCVRSTLQARHEMPWGKKIPEREWKHFVLPVRVNNENLDDARTVLYQELKDRVKDLNMYDAVLEVNHWCHEHVTYQPSNSRTKSPLVTMRTAIGRCGEESTFTVAALRAVGIPARQVYTPRWAHTDDNHAWVEAWVDGKWHFLGACEPEAVLDLGWFNAPASRGMLMHTKVFGNYDGPEEVVSRNACYTEINVTENYAPVSKLIVKVEDSEGKAVPSAIVDFRLYNYGEFYPLVTKETDSQGTTFLTSGLGDLLVWASQKNRFGFQKASVGTQDTVTVVLTYDESFSGSFDLEFTPPSEHKNIPDQTEEQIECNKRRLAHEDSIRNAYMKENFAQIQFKNENQEDNEEASKLFYETMPELRARSNWKTIQEFQQSRSSSNRSGDVVLTLNDKDLSDVSMDVLKDAATQTIFVHHPLWKDYVLAPRISNEMLTPYRATLKEAFSGMGEVSKLIQWTRDSITVDDSRNPQLLCMSPVGVYRNRVTDRHSRDIFFVAAARSIGIFSRIDEVTGKVQWADFSSNWHDVFFEEEKQEQEPQGNLLLAYTNTELQQNPAYYSHFSISLMQEGRPQLQEFPEDATWKSTFKDATSMSAGQYLLVTGTRLANGGVLAHLEFFPIQANQTTSVPLILRNDKDELRVLGNFDSESLFNTMAGNETSVLKTTGRGYFVIGLIRSNHEPSNHVLRDLAAVAPQLEQWGRTIVLLFPNQEEADTFQAKDFPNLPANVTFGVASKNTADALMHNKLVKGDELPIIFMADTFNRIVWSSQGYTIGLGEQLLQVIRKL